MVDFYGKDASSLKRKSLFLLDMDGTVYRENTLFTGVKEVLASIAARGGKYVFITNNSSKSVKDYEAKLRNMGVPVTEENFYTSTQAACALLKARYPGALVYAQGTRSFLEELRASGIRVTEQFRPDIQAVLVGFDPELTGEKLRVTCKVLTKLSVPYLATNPDWVCPVEFGFVPDCGSMCFGIEKATGKRPEFIGKPQPTMIFTAMEKFSKTKEETLVIGDRLYTDVASGLNAGVDTVCVLSGEVSEADIQKSDIKPTYVLESVACLFGGKEGE